MHTVGEESNVYRRFFYVLYNIRPEANILQLSVRFLPDSFEM
jgi:hypothetical protein